MQARLKDKNATIEQFGEAVLSEEIVKMLTGLDKSYFGDIGFRLSESDFGHIVDFAGAMIANHLDVESYIGYAMGITDIKEFDEFIAQTETALKEAINKEAKVYTAGWFGQILAHFSTMAIEKLMLDHGDAGDANASIFLDEFWIFMSVMSTYSSSGIYMDFFQSYPLTITNAYFLSKNLPQINSQEASVRFPEIYPLSVERTIPLVGVDFQYDKPAYALAHVSWRYR